jgi:hypothetical protein
LSRWIFFGCLSSGPFIELIHRPKLRRKSIEEHTWGGAYGLFQEEEYITTTVDTNDVSPSPMECKC